MKCIVTDKKEAAKLNGLIVKLFNTKEIPCAIKSHRLENIFNKNYNYYCVFDFNYLLFPNNMSIYDSIFDINDANCLYICNLNFSAEELVEWSGVSGYSLLKISRGDSLDTFRNAIGLKNTKFSPFDVYVDFAGFVLDGGNFCCWASSFFEIANIGFDSEDDAMNFIQKNSTIKFLSKNTISEFLNKDFNVLCDMFGDIIERMVHLD